MARAEITHALCVLSHPSTPFDNSTLSLSRRLYSFSEGASPCFVVLRFCFSAAFVLPPALLLFRSSRPVCEPCSPSRCASAADSLLSGSDAGALLPPAWLPPAGLPPPTWLLPPVGLPPPPGPLSSSRRSSSRILCCAAPRSACTTATRSSDRCARPSTSLLNNNTTGVILFSFFDFLIFSCFHVFIFSFFQFFSFSVFQFFSFQFCYIYFFHLFNLQKRQSMQTYKSYSFTKKTNK